MKDSKSLGMNWTENIYLKIEEIVPEVNDIKIQDTFKYVENHVHTVGGTFKKFYSGVVQDFFPLSTDTVKCETKVVASEGNVATGTNKCDNSVIKTVQVSSSEAEPKQSPVEIDVVDLAEKHLGHICTEDHNEDKLSDAKSAYSHDDSDSALTARKNNVLEKENSKLRNDVDSIEESEDGPLDDTFKYVEDQVHAVGGALKKFCSGVVQDFFPLSVDLVNCEAEAMAPVGDAAIGTNGNNKSAMSMAEVSSDAAVKQSSVAIDGEKRLGSVSSEHENEDEIKNALSMDSCENSDASVNHSPAAIDVIDHGEKRLGNVSSGHENEGGIKNALSMDSHENSDSTLAPMEMTLLTDENSDLGNGVDATKASADEQLELNSHGVTEPMEEASVEILDDAAERDFGASSGLSETAFSVVSGEVTITGTGLDSSSSSIFRDSANTPGYSSDISSAEECFSDSCKWRLSSRPASTMSAEDESIMKQLVSSCSHLSLESNDDSDAVVADSGMENIDLCDEVKLGESCVFLDDSVLYDVSRRTRKLGSYKKKIQDMFTSKKRLAKEYERLAIWYGDTNIDSRQDAPPVLRNLQTRYSSDSEWELL